MNPKLRQKAKNNFEKDVFPLIIKTGFGKTMENERKNRKEKKLFSNRNKLSY